MINKNTILRNLQEISSANNHMLKNLSLIAAVIWAFLAALSAATGDSLLFYGYGLCGLVSAAVFGLSKWFIPKHLNLVLPLAYVYLFYCLAFTVYLDNFTLPRSTSVAFICLLLIAPMVILDRRWRVNTLMVITSTVFAVITILYQPPDLARLDLLNCIIYCTIGIFIGQVMFSVRVSNIEMNRKLTKQRDTDNLTSLSNRWKLSDTLESWEDNHGLSFLNVVLMIDIDHFKKYNDYYGHQQGDAVLKELGKCFSSFFRSYHLEVFRYGGEEFIALGREYNYDEISVICQSLLQTVRDLEIPFKESPWGMITISVGFAEAMSCQANNYKILIDMADQALYKAKERGRNRVEGYLE